jgi:hypothetical protein
MPTQGDLFSDGADRDQCPRGAGFPRISLVRDLPRMPKSQFENRTLLVAQPSVIKIGEPRH